MQKYIQYFFILIISFLILQMSACSTNRSNNNTILKDIIPKSTENISIVESSILKSNENISQEISDTTVSSETVFSSLVPRNYSIIGVKWANLDIDDLEEAVVIITKKGSSFVNVLIAKFDTNNERYFFLWQETTNIINSSFISLNIYDINNDGKKEIIIEGNNETLQQHLIVFYLDDTDYNIRNYKVIFTVSGVGGGDIELQLPQNSYSPVNIVVYHINEIQQSIEKKLYIWNTTISNFTLRSTDVSSFEDQAQERMNTLNTRDTKVWLDFLNGLWAYTENSQETSNIKNDKKYIIYFSENTPELSLIKNDSMKLYQWSNKASRMFRSHIGIQIQVSNILLPDIFASLSVEVLSEKRINVNLERDEYSEAISGVFTKVSINNILKDNHTLFSLFDKYAITQTLQKLQTWMIGNKKEKDSNNIYVFSPDTVSIFILNNNTVYKYKIFNIANDFFIELKNNESRLFYKFTSIHEIDFDDEESLSALPLQPYVITSNKSYPLDNAKDIILEKNENNN